MFGFKIEGRFIFSFLEWLSEDVNYNRKLQQRTLRNNQEGITEQAQS